MNYHELNNVVTPISVTVSDVVSFLGQINRSPCAWYIAINLVIPILCMYWESQSEAVCFELSKANNRCPLS